MARPVEVGMTAKVDRSDGTFRLAGSWPGVEATNAFLAHLEIRRFAPATVRAYAFDVGCLAGFLEERGIGLDAVVPTDIFDWVDWQTTSKRRAGKVVPLRP